MGTFAYVDILIPFVAAVFIAVCAVFYIFFKRYENSLVADEPRGVSAFQLLFTYDFHSCYECVVGSRWNVVLLSTRVITFLYFFSVGLVYSLTLNIRSWNYFTNWNIYLLCFYFLCASTTSIIGIFFPNATTATIATASDWRSIQYWIPKLNVVTHVVFEISGATALFVTVVNFTMLSSNMTFWNVTQHLVTTVAYLLEMSLNRLPVYMLHFPLNLSWAILYIVFTWIVVGVGLRFWPYSFLRADNSSCMIWYSALMILNFIFYGLWFQLSKWKFAAASRGQRAAVAGASNHELVAQHENAELELGEHRRSSGASSSAIESERVSDVESVPISAASVGVPSVMGEDNVGGSAISGGNDNSSAIVLGSQCSDYEAVLGDDTNC